MEIKLLQLKRLVEISNRLFSLTEEYIFEEGDFYNEIDTKLRKVLNEEAHKLVDEMGITYKG